MNARANRRAPEAANGRTGMPRPATTGRALPVIALLLALATLTLRPAIAAAETAFQASEPPVLALTQQDLDADGNPNLTIIDTVIATPYDRVLVYDGGGNMRRSSDWREATDFKDDTWVFDIGGEGSAAGTATLIIVFTTEGDDTLARVYDGRTTGGRVRYDNLGASIRPAEPRYPALTIRVKGDWTDESGALNYNLNWDIDGPLADVETAARYPHLFVLDGGRDAEGEARDADGDGAPEYLWTTLLATVPETEGISRTGILVNEGRKRPSDPERVIFWPLLNTPENPHDKNYFDTSIFLNVNWEAGQVEDFGFGGYPVEEGYHINSQDSLRRDVTNVLSFENPMAYYDLAADRDGRPELFIRMAYTPLGTPRFVPHGPTNTPVEMVQYSWNQWNHEQLLWDFKVDLAGRNAIEHTVTLGEMVIEQVPYDLLPGWVMTKPWGFGTLVAYETGDGYLSSEGIYDWSTLEGVQRYEGIYSGAPISGARSYTSSDINSVPGSTEIQRAYITGASTQSPADLYRSILVGYRGEYADIEGAVEMYFSPVDARLHLAGASHGVYNIGNRRRLEYRNTNGDDYIDSWQLYADTQLIAQLDQSRDFLVYAADNQLTLLRAEAPHEAFRVQPPTNHEEWLALGARLQEQRRDYPLADLRAALDQFDGRRTEVSNASVSGYRTLEGGGFRFVLELRPGFAVSGEDELGLANLAPGRYAVTYDGQFRIEPSTPPAISGGVTEGLTLRQNEHGTVSVALENAGFEDVPQATLEVWATPPQGRTVRIASETVALLGHTRTTTTTMWAPPEPGEWLLKTQVHHESGLLSTSEPVPVVVEPAAAATFTSLMDASTSPWAVFLAALMLLVATTTASALFWRQWLMAGTESRR